MHYLYCFKRNLLETILSQWLFRQWPHVMRLLRSSLTHQSSIARLSESKQDGLSTHPCSSGYWNPSLRPSLGLACHNMDQLTIWTGGQSRILVHHFSSSNPVDEFGTRYRCEIDCVCLLLFLTMNFSDLVDWVPSVLAWLAHYWSWLAHDWYSIKSLHHRYI